jgi:hypothetical protein
VSEHTIIKICETQIFRTPATYIAWFEGLLQSIHVDRSLNEQARRHAGILKQFYEEMFPLYSLLRVKKDIWAASEFRNVFGSQNYDIEIRYNDLMYLEVVTTDFDDGELFRGKVLSAKKSVDAIAPIVRDEQGRPIGFMNEGDCRLHDDVVSEVLTLAESRLRAKIEKSYPAKTGLVINVDDYKSNLNEGDWGRFSVMLGSMRTDWRSVFESVFVVGPKARDWIEMS